MGAHYQPVSRRPIAALFRKTADGTVGFCVRWNIHPDTISCLSMVAAAIAAACFWQASRYHWLLLAGPVFCGIRLWLNMLDGMVALAANKASVRGEILNDFPDRISDVIIFAGVAHSGLCSPFTAYWAAIMALLTAYVGTFGQAVGVQREFSGIMSKPWRMVSLQIGSWTAFFVADSGTPGPVVIGPLTVLDVTCLVIVAGCVQTVAVRLKKIFRALEMKSKSTAGIE